MSDICGIFNFNNQPVLQHNLLAMTSVLNYPSFEGEEFVIDGNIGLGYKHQATVTSFSKAKLPFSTENKELVLVADVRIDNKVELAKKLNYNISNDYELSDSELIIAAYRKWGEFCGAEIIGDYAFVIWDKSKRKLICVRDVFGNRPLFYYIDNKKFIFASQIKQILAVPEVPRNINEMAIAHYLTGRPLGYLIGNTFYQKIFRNKPARVLEVNSAGEVKTKKYWDIERSKKIVLNNNKEYEEAFFSLLSTSVKAQARTQDTIGIMVSGGMDSTSVTTMLAYNQIDNYKLFNISYGSSHAADESRYVEELASKLDADLITVDGSENLPFSNLFEQANNHDEPLINWDYANANNSFEKIRESGCRSLLTGYSGDSLFLVQPFIFIDYLKQFRFSHAYKEYQAYIKKRGEVSHAQMFRLSATKLLPDNFKNILKRNIKNDNQLIHPDLLSQLERCENGNEPFNLNKYGFLTNHQNQRYYYFTEYFVNFIQIIHQLTSIHGLESRDPLGDRRIVEFMLAIPPEQCLNDGVTKFILRNAMQGHLPESIRTRVDKTVFDSVIFQGFNQWLSNNPEMPNQNWLSVKNGYIVAQTAQKQLQLLKDVCKRSDRPNMGLLQSHMKLQLLEQWLIKTYE